MILIIDRNETGIPGSRIGMVLKKPQAGSGNPKPSIGVGQDKYRNPGRSLRNDVQG